MSRKNSTGRRKLGFFNTLVLLVNLFFILLLISSYLALFISPADCRALPFSGLLYPYLVITNMVFIIYWIISRRWHFLLPAIVIAAGWPQLQRNLQVRFAGDQVAMAAQFKLLSYNVKNLSNDNVDLLEPEIRNNILSFLEQEQADILCLQECSIVHPDPEAFIDSLMVRLGMLHHALSNYVEKPGKRLDAIFIFSKYPVINSGSLKKENGHNYALYADVVIHEDTIRLYNVHLESIHLRHEDYSFISELDLQFNERENLKEGSQRIISKLIKAFGKRAAQADALAEHIAFSPYPVILCGDFNDTPNSYTYQRLTSNLYDAFMESGSGLGNTYIGNLPSYRIDFILYSDHFISGGYNREPVKFSDHYPISCYIGTRKN